MSPKVSAALSRRPRSPYPNIGRQKLLAKLEPLLSPKELGNVAAAYQFAKYGHRGQSRDSNRVRYFEHPKAVALMIIDELQICDWRTVTLALLHDIQEDSYLLTWDRIQRNFGTAVTRELRLLTKRPKNGYIARLRLHGNTRTLIVKLCDRVHNLRTLCSCSPKKQRGQIRETRRHHIPLADLLISKLPRRERWRGEYLKTEMASLCDARERILA